MTTALQERLAAARGIPTTEEIEEESVDEFTKARAEYREAREKIDLYNEGIKARAYIAQLEERLATRESQIRNMSKSRNRGW